MSQVNFQAKSVSTSIPLINMCIYIYLIFAFEATILEPGFMKRNAQHSQKLIPAAFSGFLDDENFA